MFNAAQADTQDQAGVRQRLNPGWQRQLKVHREELFIGPETKGMGAKEIVKRALRLQGILLPSKKKGAGIERYFK